MKKHSRWHELRSDQYRPVITLIVLAVVAVVTIGSNQVIKHLTSLAEQRYFAQLPAEVKTTYIPQLSQLDRSAPAGLWETACYQYVDNDNSGSPSPVTCGVWAGEFIDTGLTLTQAKVQFQKLTSVAISQGFSNAKTTYNYEPSSNSPAVDIHFAATGHDRNCTVTADYGKSYDLAQLATNPQMLNSAGNSDTPAIFYYLQCSKQITKSVNTQGSNVYVFPGTAGGYPLTQAQGGYPYGAGGNNPDPFATVGK